MANKAILVQGGDGTAVPAGMVGEKIAWANGTSTSLANNSGYQRVGGSTQGITLTPGIYLAFVNGTGTPSTQAMRIVTDIQVVSGSASVSICGGPDSVFAMDASGNSLLQTQTAYIAVTTTAVVALYANPAGGTVASSRVYNGFAIRMAGG